MHNLNKNEKTGKYSFVTKQELAWHKCGQVVDSMTSKECMTLAGLDFEVGLAPLVALVNNPILIEESKKTDIVTKINSTLYRSKEVEGNFATYRTDTSEVFGVVGSRYEVVQNIEAFDFFDDIIGQGHAQYETAGALGNGETIFITAKLPDHIKVKGEEIDKYLLFTMSHDGTSSIKVMFTPIRVVCNNTLTAALSECKERITIKHTRNARQRLEIAPTLLGIDKKASEKYAEIFNRFKEVKMTDDEFTNLIDGVFGFDYEPISDLSSKAVNKRNSIIEYNEVGIGQEGITGTLWGAYNAVTGYLQNGIIKSAETQFKNEFFKTNADIRTKTMNKLLTLAK